MKKGVLNSARQVFEEGLWTKIGACLQFNSSTQLHSGLDQRKIVFKNKWTQCIEYAENVCMDKTKTVLKEFRFQYIKFRLTCTLTNCIKHHIALNERKVTPNNLKN